MLYRKRGLANTDHHVLSVARVQFSRCRTLGSRRDGSLFQGAIGRARHFRILAAAWNEPLPHPRLGTSRRPRTTAHAHRNGRRFWGPAAGCQAPGPSWRAMTVLGAAAGGCGWFWVAWASCSDSAGPVVVVGTYAEYLRQRPQRREHQVLHPDGR